MNDTNINNIFSEYCGISESRINTILERFALPNGILLSDAFEKINSPDCADLSTRERELVFYYLGIATAVSLLEQKAKV